MLSKEEELQKLKRVKYHRILVLGNQDNNWHLLEELREDESTNPFDYVRDNKEDFIDETFKVEVVYRYE